MSNLPVTTTVADLVRFAKMRWRIEHDYLELKHGLGLDHFEGRTWRGWVTKSSTRYRTAAVLGRHLHRLRPPPSRPRRTRTCTKHYWGASCGSGRGLITANEASNAGYATLYSSNRWRGQGRELRREASLQGLRHRCNSAKQARRGRSASRVLCEISTAMGSQMNTTHFAAAGLTGGWKGWVGG